MNRRPRIKPDPMMGRGYYIVDTYSPNEYLFGDGEWRTGVCKEYGNAFWPTREAAEDFLNNCTRDGWREQLKALNDPNEDDPGWWALSPDNRDSSKPLVWVCYDAEPFPQKGYRRFTGDTPEQAVNAAYKAIIGGES